MQNYVCEDLTHFVGRHEPNDDTRYDLLLKIFRSGELLDPKYQEKRDWPIFHFDLARDPRRHENFYPDPYFEVRLDGSVSENEFVAPESVCFCDIPIDQLDLHTTKYSRFGLAFAKAFLVKQGANPVMYVARTAATPMRLLPDAGGEDFFGSDFDASNRADFFERLKERTFEVSERDKERLEAAFAAYERGRDDAQALRSWLVSHIDFTIGAFAYVFGYLKTFDPGLAEDDPNNYYMEREWRVIGRVRFTPSDVRRVVLPASYVTRFREDEPSYGGEVVSL